MNIQNGQCLHVVLFGTFNEGKYFLQEFKNSFDLVGFNANIIAHAPQGISALVAKMTTKNYFIDPQFHAFQQPIRTIMRKKGDKWVVKESIKKLAERYGEVVLENLGKASIVAGQLTKSQKEELVENVINFQWSILEEARKNHEYDEFLEYAQLELRPQLLIAPHFFIEPDNFDNELADNIEFVDLSKKYLCSDTVLNEQPLFGEMILHKETLANPDMIRKVVEGYSQCDVDGFILWIDDFQEVNETESLLNDYVRFLIQLKERTNKPVINLHGSYFSICLSGKVIGLLAGVGHGIEYGEYRPVIPVGGGIPLAKFYFPRFHKRINYDPDASNILLEMGWIKNKQIYFENVCACVTCKQVIVDNDVMNGFQAYGKSEISEKSGKAYPSPEAMDLSRKHYLHNKIREYQFCETASMENIISELYEANNIAKKVEKIHPFQHLKKWINVLSRLNL